MEKLALLKVTYSGMENWNFALSFLHDVKGKLENFLLLSLFYLSDVLRNIRNIKSGISWFC